MKRTRFIGVPDWGRPTLLTFTALPWDGIVHKAIWVEPPRLRPVDMRDPGEVVEHIHDGSEIEIAERTSPRLRREAAN